MRIKKELILSQSVIIFLATLCLVVLLNLGCAGNHGVTVAGSTSIQPFLEVLADHFEKETKIKVNIEGGGSSVGVQSVYNGSADIGSVSRNLKPEEKGLEEFVIAWDGIAVIVHPSNPIAELSIGQLQDIFLGEIKNWRELGGNDVSISVVVREEGSGTREAFSNLVMEEKPFIDKAIVQGSTGSVKQTVSTVPGAIGFISLAQVDENIKVISIDGIKPTAKTILSGEYAIARPFLLVTKDKPAGSSKKFIDFILSKEGQKILSDSGVLPARAGGS